MKKWCLPCLELFIIGKRFGNETKLIETPEDDVFGR